MTCRVILSNNS